MKPWTYDISDWIDWNGNQNSLLYQGLYDGQNYVPQNEQSGANQNIHANIWIVYYTNSSSNGSAQMENPPPSQSSESGPTDYATVFKLARDEEHLPRED